MEAGDNLENDRGVITLTDSSDDHEEGNNDTEQGDNIIPTEAAEEDLTGCLIGMKRNSVEEIYTLYRNHARQLGFSIRKTTTRCNDVGVVTEKYFVCSCEGSKRSSNNSEKKKKKFYNTRTGCKGSLRTKLNSDGVYEIVDHCMLHNHELTRKEWSHLHRSERVITTEKANAIGEMISSGMRATESFRYMAQDAGGEECIGHTMKDHLNFVNRFKMNAIEAGDAQTLIDMLYQQSAEDQDFFFRVKLDDMGRLCNLFWRDSMMKEDYKIYGDVVVFDTTYRTNRYNLICAPFVGINNHWKNVMFGCAFIADEKTESFDWLFEVFKKSMEGQCPISIFTDQDLAIGNSIEKVFPGTRHRLCLWHLYQNAVSRFGRLKGDKCFNDAFTKCLSGCTTEAEFQDCWDKMITKNGLESHPWFKRLFDLREKWCTTFNKDFFSAGILSSQRSESTNYAIGFNAKKTTSLTDFYGIFKETIKRWRSNEAKDEFQCSRVAPTSVLPLTGLLKHASEVYTLTLFKDFEDEFLKSISTSCTMLHFESDIMFYTVSNDDGVGSHTVTFCTATKLISCSCKRFEECGLLCCHSLRVLHVNSVTEIQNCYIKRRWTKFAKKDLWDRLDRGIGLSNRPKDCIPWRHEMARKYYNLVLKCQENEEERRIIEDGYHRDSMAIDELMAATMNSTAETEISSSSTSILDPTRSVTKGRKQRAKGHFEKNKKKKSADTSNTNTSREFGTKTPNPRLF